MNRFFRILAGILFLCFTGFTYKAECTEWTIVSSTVSFKIKNAGFNIDGKFGSVTGAIIFDAAKNYNNSIVANIDSKSINTGNGTRDGHLKKKNYFDVESFPKISMKASLFGKEKDGSFRGYFQLTMKDKTKDLLLPFSFIETENKGVFKATFRINRLDYGVGESSMILSDNATITLIVNVVKAK